MSNTPDRTRITSLAAISAAPLGAVARAAIAAAAGVVAGAGAAAAAAGTKSVQDWGQ